MGSSSSKAWSESPARNHHHHRRSSSCCLGGSDNLAAVEVVEEENSINKQNDDDDDDVLEEEEEEESEEDDAKFDATPSSSTLSRRRSSSSLFSFIPRNLSFSRLTTRPPPLPSVVSLYPTTTTNNETLVDHPLQSTHPNTSTRQPPPPLQRSLHFTRTLSVGRLRDRVLRTSSSFTHHTTTPTTTTTTPPPPPTTHSSPLSPTMSPSTQPPRQQLYHDIMEHRRDFLERRRRIRSQVRALQRLGSRFENLSGHDRSCVLAGQHRSGRCTCTTINRTTTTNHHDDTSARASISRIVMLAEALFEVLDEIHQQSVVMSSRPSLSSIGSIPAPKEVVESMPVKIYSKLQKHQLEDVAQCYICLVEYEDGDCMRTLPCHHEFHRTCIDKWLKEIHRVCPLCRGDVCSSDSLPSDN